MTYDIDEMAFSLINEIIIIYKSIIKWIQLKIWIIFCKF